MNVNEIVTEKLNTLKENISSPERFPVSVYRLQFNSSFTFRDGHRLVPYLHKLGITECYASPYFKARRGSQHGYDISDQNSLNPEIGSPEEFQNFVNQLQRYNMGQIIDFVPNHMSIFDNPKWRDVLENGPSSIYARYFDIDWEPVNTELHLKVLLPILEDMYGVVLVKGQINLRFEQGAFYIRYQNHLLPVGPKTIAPVLESILNHLQETLKESDPDLLELQSIITACNNLPEQCETEPERMVERHREKEIIKRRLGELCRINEKIKSGIAETIKIYNGRVEVNESFIKLHELLEKQNYRLSFWRVAGEEINYRRFFDVNELVALRMEDPLVFTETHQLVRELFSKGLITGIRIDHVDGLFDPADYLRRLQKDCWLDWVMQKLRQESQLFSIDPETLKQSVDQKISPDFQEKSAAAFRPVYIIVEKILGENERINQDWLVEGTTGYDFMAALNQIFVDRKQSGKLLDTYRRFTGSHTSFDDIAYDCKNLVMKTTMVGEINLLAHQLEIISEKSWQYRDFTLNSLRDAIREVIACFPVYRTYVNACTGSVSENDKAVIDHAIGDAKRRNPAVSSAIFDFVRDTLLLQYPASMDEAGRNEQCLFVMHFQQYTGPVMAKGVEDTAFCIYNPLVSLNEVGDNPRKLGTSVREFHKQNFRRQLNSPRSFVTTSTHDSKRGEDVRARINVLSEIPGVWRSALIRWSQLNKGKKLKVNDELIPDQNEEYLLYQTLIGTYPTDKIPEKDLIAYRSRIQNYMLKAIREAKVHTSWINPNNAYEKGVTGFVEAILNPSPDNSFLIDFQVLNQIAATCGMYSSLSQVVLKIFSPGVPDIYLGNELWAYNLTDPDNRTAVDYEHRIRLLNQLAEQSVSPRRLKRLIKDLLDHSNDGRIKLYVTWKSLNYRKDNKALFDGDYLPLKMIGPQKDLLCAFTWHKGNKTIFVIVPRFMTSLTHQALIRPLGKDVWEDTHIIIPRKLRYEGYRNIFTGEIIQINNGFSPGLLLSEVFRSFPVAVLESVN